jgi:uncharacterized protein (TIGR02594 family)
MAQPLDLARSMIGHTEKEAAIKEYLKNGGVNLDPETQAWCASFVNATLQQSGLPTGGIDAMSFKKYGDPVVTPRPGDIGVFKRSDPNAASWQGHAGFYSGTDDYGDPILVSGNANDQVMEHSIDSDRLIGWRRPPGVKEPSLPETLAAAVGPETQGAIDRTDYSRNRPAPMGPVMTANDSSPFGRVGAMITPSIVGAFRKKRDREQQQLAAMLAATMGNPQR